MVTEFYLGAITESTLKHQDFRDSNYLIHHRFNQNSSHCFFTIPSRKNKKKF